MVGKKSHQLSFALRQGKFNNASSLIQSWDNYNPSNASIGKTSLISFIEEVQLKNNALTSAKIALDNARAERKTLCFFNSKSNNSFCLEIHLMQIANYTASCFGINSVEHKRIHDMLKKIKPNLVKGRHKRMKRGFKRTNPAKSILNKKVKEKLERSFIAMAGFAQSTAEFISELIENGFNWNPPDENLSHTAIKNISEKLQELNSIIPVLNDNYKIAISERKEIYKSMNERIGMIKSYLASFDGGKKYEHFIEFSQAIKGT